MGWQDDPVVSSPAPVAIPFPHNEAGLAGFGNISPQDQIVQDQQDQTPNNLADLANQLKLYQTKGNAAGVAALQQEQQRLASATPPSTSSWQNDPVVSSQFQPSSTGSWVNDPIVHSKPSSLMPQHPWQDLTKGVVTSANAAAGTFGAVADWGLSSLAFPISGVAGLATLLGTFNPTKAAEVVQYINKNATIKPLLKTQDAQKAYEMANWAPEKLASIILKAGDNAHKALGTQSSAIEEAINEPLAQLASFALLHKAITIGTGFTVPKGPGEIPANAYKRMLTPEGETSQEGQPTAPTSTGDSYADASTTAGKETNPKGKPVTATAKGLPTASDYEALGADASPEEMENEFNKRQDSFNFNPVDQGQSGDLFDPSNRRIAPDPTNESEANLNFEGAQGNLEPLNSNEAPAKSDVPQQYIDKFEEQGGLKPVADTTPESPPPQTEDILSDENQQAIKSEQENSAWAKYKQRVAENQQAQAALDAKYANDNFQPEQSSSTIEKMQPPINDRSPLGGVGKRGFGQGGAVNMGDFGQMADRLKALKDNLLNASRDGDINAGDTVRLMNGKVGTVTAITQDGRYQITGKDFKDSVPKQGIDYKYKPAGSNYKNPNPNAGKFGQGGGVNIRNIFKGSDPNIDAMKPKGVSVPMDKQNILDTLYRLYDQSSSLEDFKEALNTQKAINPALDPRALNDAQVWWDKFEGGWKPEKSGYGQMSLLNKRESSDPRPYDIWSEEELGKKPPTTRDDIGLIKRETMAPQHMASLNFDTLGPKLIKWAYSKLADIRNQARIILGELGDAKNSMMNLSRQGQLKALRAQWEWDSGKLNDMLWNKDENGVKSTPNQWWPTKEQLMEHSKLNDKEATAYLDQAAAYDRMYQLAGIDRPKLPGYMPHTWKGLWKVYLIDKESGLFKVQGASTRFGANRIARLAKEEGAKAGREVYGDVHDPSVTQKNAFVNKISNDLLTALQGQGKLGKVAADMLIRLQDRTMEGTITEALERHGIAGYDQEMGPKPEDTIFEKFLNRRYNNSLFKSFDRAMYDGVRAWKNRTITQTVAMPFFKDAARYKDMPNTTTAVKDLIEKASGFNKQEYSLMERSIRTGLIHWGFPPDIPSRFLGMINEFARVERINSANLGFASEHAYFAFPGLMDMWRMHIDRMTMGEKRGNFVESMGSWAKGWLPGDVFRNKDETSAMQWFKDKGGYSGNYYEASQGKSVGSKLYGAATHGTLQLVVNRAKSATFSMAYHYFKDIMPRTEALEAAYNHTSKTMQSFDALDTPQIFGEGMLGKSIRPFNQIHAYNFARYMQTLDSIRLAAKYNPKMIPLAMTPALGMVMIGFLLGGAKGIVFHDDYDKIREWVNDNTSMSWPSIEQFMLRKMDMPDWAVYGAIPNAMHVPHTLTSKLGLPDMPGMDTRGTFTTNVTGSLSGAGLGAAVDAGQYAIQKGIGLTTGAENADATWKLGRSLSPSTLVPWEEDNAAKRLGGNPKEKFDFTRLGTGKGNIPEASKLDPKSPRTPGEDLEYKLLSKAPITESIRDNKVMIAKEMDKEASKVNTLAVRTIVNKILGFNTGSKDIGQLMKDAINRDTGFSSETLNNQIMEEIPERSIPAAITYLTKAANSSNDEEKGARMRRLISILRDGKHLGE